MDRRIFTDADGDRWIRTPVMDVPIDRPPVEWRHDGTGNLILAGGVGWRKPPRFKLAFGYSRFEHLEAGRARALERDPGGASWPHSQVSWYDRVMASLLDATDEAQAWRRLNSVGAAS